MRWVKIKGSYEIQYCWGENFTIQWNNFCGSTNCNNFVLKNYVENINFNHPYVSAVSGKVLPLLEEIYAV